MVVAREYSPFVLFTDLTFSYKYLISCALDGLIKRIQIQAHNSCIFAWPNLDLLHLTSDVCCCCCFSGQQFKLPSELVDGTDTYITDFHRTLPPHREFQNTTSRRKQLVAG